MEIESMVANSALIRAREDGGSKGRSRGWKDMLRFPHISECTELAMSIERDYWRLCVKQPIGKKMFELFCQSRPDLKNFVLLLEALDEFETQVDKKRREFGEHIIQRFFKLQSLPIVQKHEEACRQNLNFNPCGDVFGDCREELHEHLSGEPFVQYQDSMFFDRFLQWKMLERQPVTKQNFRQYRLLGKGGFGEVWACQVRATGKMYACKKLEKTHVKKRKGEAMALNEKQILEDVDSRFVVNLAYAYETKHALCLVVTMMSGGDLKFHIYNIGKPGLDNARVCFYAAEVCCGLIHLHQKSILYRDLKPENILLDDHGHIRISDLGLAVKLSEGSLVRGRVGTLGYMAPEVIGREHYGYSADWWGLGCLIYEMAAGHPPFRSKGEHPQPPDMERRIQTQQEEYDKISNKLTKEICSLLLTKDPKRRLGCYGSMGKAVQAHPFFHSINFRMLEAGLVEPPFKPDVYCNDVLDIDEFSAVKGVVLNESDDNFYAKFNTGRVPVAWQNEIIEMGCFKELNTFGHGGSRSPDLVWAQRPKCVDSPRRGLLSRIFRRNQPPNSSDESQQNLMTTDSYTRLRDNTNL